MPKTATGLLMSAAVVAYGALFAGAHAQDQSSLDDGCSQAQEEAVETIAKKYGFAGFGPASSAYSVLKAYLSAPDNEKYDALLKTLREEGAGLVIPGFDVVRAGGMIVIGGIEYTIGQAEAAQLDAFLCGGGEVLAEGIFQMQGAQAIAPGVTCENFADKITTIEQFDRLKRLFDGFYTRQVLQLGGRQNEANYRRILYEQWQLIDRTWKAKRGARLYRNLQEDLIREAERMRAKAVCKDPAAIAKGPHLEMIEAKPEIASTVPEWKKTVNPGKITIDMPYVGRSECTWNQLPKFFYKGDKFDLTLTVLAVPQPGQRLASALQLRTGLVASIPAGSGPEVSAEPGIVTETTLEVKVETPDLTFMKQGDRVYLTLGGCAAGNVNYMYEYHPK